MNAGRGEKPAHRAIASAVTDSLELVTLRDTGEVMWYDQESGSYRRGGEARVAELIESEFGETVTVTNQLVNEVLGHVRRQTYVDRRMFDADPAILNVQNGLLSVDTMGFGPHGTLSLSMVQLPVRFDPAAKCPKIAAFLSQVLREEDIPAFQEYVGYTLWKGYPAQVALLLVGEGENGKSTVLALVKALLGSDCISARGLQELEWNRFAKADLFGKLANIYADLPGSALKSVGIFKMLTGGDPIHAERKFQNAFLFVNNAKLMFSANKVPEVYEDSTAFFRRWIMIVFPNRFEGNQANRNLLSELTTPEEMSGFLNWALEGLKRLRGNAWRFTNSRSTEEIRVDYIRKSSPIRAFVMDCVEISPEGNVPKQELFAAFVDYCKGAVLPLVTSATFFQNLPMHAKVETAKLEVGGRRVNCFTGIRLRPKETWGKNDGEEAENKVGKDLDMPDSPDSRGHDGSPVQEVRDISNLSSADMAEPTLADWMPEGTAEKGD